MSLRYFSNIHRQLVLSTLILGVAFATPVCAASGPAVQTYADQAVPTATPASQQYYDSPLAAGTLTLQDVLEAHKPSTQAPTLPPIGGSPSATATAPLLTPPVASSSTGLMMSQGMKAVLEKVGTNGVPASGATAVASPAQGAPLPLTTSPPVDANGVQYQPGQEPKNLATGQPAAMPVAAAASAASSGTPVSLGTATPSTPGSDMASPSSLVAGDTSKSDQSCDQKIQKWEKSCSDAGYPATYLGKIVGETRTGCADGVLHDVWVTNTCAPSDTATGETVKTDGACGSASNEDFEKAPNSNLCAQGIASDVSGDGPWTWACSGVNGGAAAACVAPKHVAISNATCGDANGVAVSSAPTDDLCRSGKATAVKGSGPWTWSCKGSGKGRTESCIAPVAASASSAAPVPVPSSEPIMSAAPAPTSSPISAPVATSSGEKGELCGAAAETLAYEAPDKDLCRAGNASVVNGDGPWTWSCTSNEGLTSSCRTLSLTGTDNAPAAATDSGVPQAAPQTPVASAPPSSPHLQEAPFATASSAPVHETVPDLACGSAALQPTAVMPTADLCQGGKASVVRGSGPWHWSCSNKAHHKVSCQTPQSLDGACGPANGTSLKSAPFAGLCSYGTPSGIDGNGPWTWTCNGTGGGVNVSCAAALQGKASSVDGACGTSDSANLAQAPTAGLCASGTPSDVSGDGPWTWSCSGSNGGSVSSCSAIKIVPTRPPGPSVNGLCGPANGVTSQAQPTDGLCNAGTLSGVVGNGPWNWSCIGENGGMTVSCTAPLEPPAPIDGACGGANGVPTLVKPVSGLCSAGITGLVNGRGPWTWTCSGANGGSPASCVAPVAGKSGSLPSTMTPASDDDMLAVPSAAPAGLVTPQLPSSSKIPSLDKHVLPSLTSSKAFIPAPTPSPLPPVANVMGNEAPDVAPDLPPGSLPLQPPSIGSSLPSAPVLQESSRSVTSIPGNHLTLDPTISTILFAHGSGNIGDDVLSTLDKLSTVLQNNPDVRISLIAYADNSGSTPRDARRLSLSRALAVKDYLSAHGISESRVDIHAEGANSVSGYIDRVDVKVND